jgi:hypothetical protein
MTPQEERIAAVLEGLLPEEVLSDDDIELLQERVRVAIKKKFADGHVILHDGVPRTLQ